MKLRIAGLTKESVVDGPGIRFVVFVQGCPHHCPGCHNPETLDFAGGEEITVDELFVQIRDTRLLQGVTFSGGEPFAQAAALAYLGKKVKELGLDIVTYTGYTFEEVLDMAEKKQEVRDLLEISDLLVDGPYLAEERDQSIAFRGSRNQRILSVAESLRAKRAVEAVL
ncbi:MAG: anaerobic ribonucleoside-triphosphate reductase activating protein [Thermacetogeniaceae bacterium]|jgi:anaerobic ribonucleoside-triphosphate reductase activating protein|nr:anaerobic ribonucleoside-triphosphate reductase activating protein [Thermoanaerobacterales bacterium]NLN22133.1 anaerobic ribonucleoside-triphosphate reductase activating protein [Syntrophomonadaceae bacterium]HAF17546.1 anaerobic ribonucleoside-triphosphate reductase activating protein [Peptococcaceae bacterium]